MATMLKVAARRADAVVFRDVATGETFVVRRRPLMRDDAWRTADGREIPLGEMEHRHIERVIAFLRRRARSLHEGAVAHMFEDALGPFGPRGDAAQDAFDHELLELERADPAEWLEGTPLVRALKSELVLRYEPWGVYEEG